MKCPRLNHFVRLNPNQTISRCGHMVHPPQFSSLNELERSDWLHNIKLKMINDEWPDECERCKQTESVNGSSMRLDAIKFHKLQKLSNYITVGGVLDNLCNSGCLTCDENHSTKIGSLKHPSYIIINNSKNFWSLPTDRIVHLDINGGEPSASKNYRHLLKNLPTNINSVRINTNCSIIIDEIYELVEKKIKVTVTVSLDGIGEVHDFIRWPIKWDKFYSNLIKYKSIANINLNTWTTISALNLGDFANIKHFVTENKLDHSYGFLYTPDVLNVKYQNHLTSSHEHLFPGVVAIDKNNQIELDEFLLQQKTLRGII